MDDSDMGTFISRYRVPVPDSWALWFPGERKAEAKVAPARLADTREGQEFVRRAVLRSEAKLEGAGTRMATMIWVPDRRTGAVQAIGGCWRLGWPPPAVRPTRDEYLIEAKKLAPAPGVTILSSSFATDEVDAGSVAVEGLATSDTPRGGFGAVLRPASSSTILQIRYTIFPDGCDEAFRIEAVVDDLDLARQASAEIARITQGVVLTLSERT